MATPRTRDHGSDYATLYEPNPAVLLKLGVGQFGVLDALKEAVADIEPDLRLVYRDYDTGIEHPSLVPACREWHQDSQD